MKWEGHAKEVLAAMKDNNGLRRLNMDDPYFRFRDYPVSFDARITVHFFTSLASCASRKNHRILVNPC